MELLTISGLMTVLKPLRSNVSITNKIIGGLCCNAT